MKLSPLQWLFVTAVIVVVAVAASPTADTPPVAAAADKTEDDDDDGDGSVFPFKALQLYNTVAGYLEYIFDMVIAPITGKYIMVVNL